MAKERATVARLGNWYAWITVMLDLKEGRFPDLPTIADALRTDEKVPLEVRKFLADYLENKIPRPSGKPKKTKTMMYKMDDQFLLDTFDAEHRRIKEIPHKARREKGTPYEIALERTAEIAAKNGLHLSTETVKKRIKDKRQRDDDLRRKFGKSADKNGKASRR